jgi:uncharacterized repeat protein (TIGR01451 family)
MRPTVTEVSPGDGASNVLRNTPIVVDFSKAMDTASVTVSLTPDRVLTGTWSHADTRLTLSHEAFAAGTRYTATVMGRDLAGISMVSPYNWAFTTGMDFAPEADLSLSKVRVGSGAVSAGDAITYTFTMTNDGPVSPISATVVDTFNAAHALASVDGPGCVWGGAEGVTCTVTDIVTGTPSTLLLVVRTREVYSGTLLNSAVVAPLDAVVDPITDNNTAGPVTVVVQTETGKQFIYLPLALRNF